MTYIYIYTSIFILQAHNVVEGNLKTKNNWRSCIHLKHGSFHTILTQSLYLCKNQSMTSPKRTSTHCIPLTGNTIIAIMIMIPRRWFIVIVVPYHISSLERHGRSSWQCDSMSDNYSPLMSISKARGLYRKAVLDFHKIQTSIQIKSVIIEILCWLWFTNLNNKMKFL